MNRDEPENEEVVAYLDYHQACEAEGLQSHTYRLWVIHGRPEGPLG